MPVGRFTYEARDSQRPHLDPLVLNQLRALRGPGESYSDVILRVASETA